MNPIVHPLPRLSPAMVRELRRRAIAEASGFCLIVVHASTYSALERRGLLHKYVLTPYGREVADLYLTSQDRRDIRFSRQDLRSLRRYGYFIEHPARTQWLRENGRTWWPLA